MSKSKCSIVVMTALALVLCFSVTAYAASSGSYSPTKTGKVTASSLNVRGNASTSGKLLGKLSKGTVVDLKGYNGDFYRIAYNGKKAYVEQKYVKRISKASYTIYTPYKKGKVMNDDVRIRASASKSGKVRGQYDKGKKLTILGKKKGSGMTWYRITYKGKASYIAAKFVKITTASTKTTKTTKKSTASKTSTKSGTVMNDDVRVRASASKSGKVRGQYDKGKKITILGSKKGSGMTWYKIKYKGKTSYIAAKFVKITVKPSKVVNYSPYKNGVTTAAVNIRSGASTSNSVRGTLKKGSSLTLRGYVVQSGKKWYKTLYAGKTSYVKASYIKDIKDASWIIYRPYMKGYSKSGTVNILKAPSASAAKISYLKKGNAITVTGSVKKEGISWYKVKTTKGTGYIKSSVLKVKYGGGADDIAKWANNKVGAAYGYGCAGPNKFDCSGFVWWVFNKADATTAKFKRSSATAYYRAFKQYSVSTSKAAKGDMVFFGSSTGNIGHVGVMAENGNVVHSTTTYGVRKQKLSSVKGCGRVVAVIRLPYK